MTLFEKAYAIFGILFAAALMTALATVPEFRQPGILFPLSFLGLLVNIGLMFVVFRDIFTRWPSNRNKKYFWLATLLVFWPAILIYLPLHGFRSKI